MKAVPSKTATRASSIEANLSREFFWGALPFQGSPLWTSVTRFPFDTMNDEISRQSKKECLTLTQLLIPTDFFRKSAILDLTQSTQEIA